MISLALLSMYNTYDEVPSYLNAFILLRLHTNNQGAEYTKATGSFECV